jgi:hypothetical protein
MVTLDHSALAILCVATEKVRTSESTSLVKFKRIFSKITLRGSIAVSKDGTVPVSETVKVNASTTVPCSQSVTKLLEGRGTRVKNVAVAFIMFPEESLNKAVELIYAHYLLFRREKSELDIHREILGHEHCTRHTKLIAKKFFTELAL